MEVTRKEQMRFRFSGRCASYQDLLRLPLLSDAELAEDLIENMFTRRHADDLTEMAKSLLELDGHEFR